jgi:hypothetical protein
VTTTPDVIDALVERATPVRRLRPPLLRAGLWLGFAAIVVALLAVGHGLRTDLALRLREPGFALAIAAALATGILAAVAAFALSLPDRSRWLALLPAPALAVWLATVGYGCLTDWVAVGPDGMHPGETLRCFATLVLTSAPLAVALAVMLRYAALLRPGAVAMTGGLAIGAVTSAALSLLHDLDATAMILVWNLGTAALIAALASLFGGNLFAWFEARLRPAREAPRP